MLSPTHTHPRQHTCVSSQNTKYTISAPLHTFAHCVLPKTLSSLLWPWIVLAQGLSWGDSQAVSWCFSHLKSWLALKNPLINSFQWLLSVSQVLHYSPHGSLSNMPEYPHNWLSPKILTRERENKMKATECEYQEACYWSLHTSQAQTKSHHLLEAFSSHDLLLLRTPLEPILYYISLLVLPFLNLFLSF